MDYFTTFADEKKSTDLNHKFKSQCFINEVKHHYNLREPKSKKPTMVFFVVRINNEQVRLSTGLKVYPHYWEKERAKESRLLPVIENQNNKLLNERLRLIDERFDEYKALANNGEIVMSKKTLKNYIYNGSIIMEEKLDVAKVLNSYLEKDQNMKDGTKDNNRRFLDKFESFLSNKDIYAYADITQKTMKEFQEWLILNVKGKGNKERASSQSINKIVSCVYAMIRRYLVNNGLMTGSHFNDIQIEELKETKIDDEIALRDDELMMLYNYQCKDKRDEEIRDLFLLECTTGQRISDIDKVANNIERKDGRTYINLVQDKSDTKIQVDIIFEMALAILDKYQDCLPTHQRKIFNKRIKEIAKEAGITGIEELRYEEAGIAGVRIEKKERYNCVSSHTGRRTFATMLSLRGWQDNEIARYTGHETLTMVHLYDKSKKGTKEKTMFESLKKERPELVLKLINEQKDNSIPQGNDVIEYIRNNEREKYKEEIKTNLGSPDFEAKLMKVYAEITNGTFKMTGSKQGYINALLKRKLIVTVRESKHIGAREVEYVIYKGTVHNIV